MESGKEIFLQITLRKRLEHSGPGECLPKCKNKAIDSKLSNSCGVSECERNDMEFNCKSEQVFH